MGLPLLIYGTGGMGRELAAWASQARRLPDPGGDRLELVGFIDDAVAAGSGLRLRELPVLPLAAAAERWPGAHVVAAVGDSQLREGLVAAARSAGLQHAPALVHPSVVLDPAGVTLGPGVIVCPGSVITTDVSLGEGVQVNVNCSITHDCRIADWATLSPGVTLSGTNWVETHAFLGSGAVTVHGAPGDPLVIGAGATVGAGAVVTASVPPGLTVVGVPARARVSG